MKGLLLQARRAAKKRNQRVTTAHALLVMVQSGGLPGTILRAAGLREGELLRNLQVVEEEPAGALERAVERASKLAQSAGREPSPLHLLLATVRDPRSAGARCIEGANVHKERVEAEFLRVLPKREAELLGLRGDPPPKIVGVPRTKIVRRPVHNPTALESPTARRAGPPGSEAKPSLGSVDENPAGRQDPPASVRTTPSPGRAATAPSSKPGQPPRGRFRRGKAKEGRRTVQEGLKQVLKPVASTAQPTPYALDPEQTPFLFSNGRNLSELAYQGCLDPLVGRQQELEQILDVLLRRRSNNPLLVGPPGVGKTALVEGLAYRLVHDAGGAERLAQVRIVELSAGSLVSGTGVRGALAERMKKLREEVQLAGGKILLFIDELHSIVGGDGPDDLAQELKPALTRGEMPCIGATTDVEYRRTIEKDSAFARRFSIVDVREPSPQDALQIIEGLSHRYEHHHGVHYDDGVLEFAVRLTHRYMPEQHLPDKAIGVLDQAAARATRLGDRLVDRKRVAQVVSERSGVPEHRLAENDHDILLNLEQRLKDRIVGHDQALHRVAELLRLSAAGLRARGTLGVFLLLGPTGVGKTELAKVVADEIFGRRGLVRLDMSEFAEAHSVARLVGSPPGYVGHHEGGQLTEPVRRSPYRLVLLDEIEKAHPDVLMALLPLLDEGRLTDSQGRTVDFSNTVIVLTSNLGGDVACSGGPIGFGGSGRQRGSESAAIAAVRAAVPPEFFNRIDEPLFFHALGDAELRELVRRLLSELADRLKLERGIELRTEPSLVDTLLRAEGVDFKLGARPIRRAITRCVEVPIANRILQKQIHAGDTITVSGKGGKLVFSGAVIEAAQPVQA